MNTEPSKNRTMQKIVANLRAFWSHMNEGPQGDWDRAHLCSMAPMSAEALRENVEAGRSHR
jgi:hypothetical protein